MTDEQPLPPVILNDAMLRRMVWDLIPHADVGPEYYASVGLGPMDEDVEEMEHEAAHDRFDLLDPILPLVTTLGNMAGNVIAQAILLRTDQELDEDEIEHLTNTVTLNVVAGSMSVLIELLDIGALIVGGEVTYE